MSSGPAAGRPTSAAADFAELLAILELHPHADGVFIGRHPSKNPVRTFGGQLMAQAFVAAARTVRAGLPPAAITMHFIAGGDPGQDLEFVVTALRDERRFANRRVEVRQGDAVLASALVAYLADSPGLEHGVSAPDVPPPDHLPRIDEHLAGYEQVVPQFVEALRPIEWRYANDPAWVLRDKGERLGHNRVWVKSEGELPTDPVLHAAALIYASDTTVLDSIITTHGLSWGHDRIFAVTMNHSVWFHRPVHFDDWLLYSTTSPVAASSRGLGTGFFFDRSGRVLASVVQQGIVKYFP